MGKQKRIIGELAGQVLESMGYQRPELKCSNCVTHVPTNCGGEHDARSSHCILNPAFWVEVAEDGWCEHFKEDNNKTKHRKTHFGVGG